MTFESLEFTRRLYQPGAFSLTVRPTDAYANTLLCGHLIIVDGNTRKSGVIEYVEETISIEGRTLTARGRTLGALLANKLTVPPAETAQYYEGWDRVRGSGETVMKHYVTKHCTDAEDASRNVPLMTVAPDLQRGPALPWQERFTPLHQVLEELYPYTKLGYEILADALNKRFIFDILPGTDHSKIQDDNPRIVFSSEFGNLASATYITDYLESANVGYAGGEGRDEDRLIYRIGNTSGFDRREVFLDCGGANIDELIDTGTAKLAEYVPKISVDAEVLQQPFVCGIDYDLGDIVTIEDAAFTLHSRIIEVTEVYEAGKAVPAWRHVFGDKIPVVRDWKSREVR